MTPLVASHMDSVWAREPQAGLARTTKGSDPTCRAGDDSYMPRSLSHVGKRGAVGRERPVPAGQTVEEQNGRFLVTKLAASPLPGDGRRCAYLQPVR